MEDTGKTPDQPAVPPWQPPPLPPAPYAPFPAFPATPAPYPPSPAAPARSRSRWGIWAAVIAGVLALGCLGAVTASGLRALEKTTEAAARGLTVPALPSASAPAPSAGPKAASGPRASTYPVREADDLQRVCDQWYYPKAPKVKSSGIQPVSVFVKDSKDFDSRTEKTLFDIPNWYTANKQKAWDPKSPAKVPLVACVDLVSTGKKIRTCKFDDPKGLKIPMREGTFRLALHEVATGKKLVDKRLKGDDEECPFVVLLGADRTVYSQVGDRRIYELLKKYVEK
jgi:hypothetical protein